MKFPCKRSFSYLSNYTQMASDSLEWSVVAGEIEDACAAERLDFMSDLNSVLLGKLPRFLLKKNNHLPSLSMETILESQFVDDFTVKKILSEVNKEWLKTKPLQLVGSNIVGKSFVDKPPKRVMMTNLSVEECQKAFKGQLCDYLTDFCQLLNSDELLSFFMEDVVDSSAKRRFEHFKHQLEKNVEKWCDDLKKMDFPLRGLSITLQKQTGKTEKNSKKPEYDISIERELDEIIRSQLTKFDEEGPATKRRRTCANQSLDLEDVLNAQMMNAHSAYDDKPEGSSVEHLSPARTNLEKEFDVFTEELASFCGNKESKKGIDTLYSPIHHIEDNLYETFEDSVVMANINKTSGNKRDEHTDDNESFGGDGFDKNDAAASKSKVAGRSIRKKRLDKEDQQENNQKRHKRKKDDKKHKLKKRKKNKHKDVENVKGKLLSLKSVERDVVCHQEHTRDQPSGKFDNKVPSRVNKTFEPDMKLYEDSHLSCGFDVYQKQKIMELLDMNFEAEFDPTLPPGEVCESPLMQLFTDSSGVMEQFVGIIPDIRQFCADLVNSKNAFLWALSLATCDPGIPNKVSDDENLKKQSAKTTGNPLIQAFRQAVEANKKKDDRISKSAYLKRGKNQPKMSFKSTGLSSLFRLNSNLKSSSKEIISSAFNSFHDEVTDLAKMENFADSSPTAELDFSAISTHFEKASQAMHALYAASEESLSSRGGIKKELIMMSNVNIISTIENTHNGNLVDTRADSSTTSVAQPTTDNQNIADSTVTQTDPQSIASAAYANYVTSKTTSAASSKGYTPAANYTSSSMYTAAPGTIAASPLAYSGYAYNPYSAMHYSQATWAYQAGYMPGYMPDLSSMQAYQNMALQSYPMMASAQVVPTVDMMQALQPATTTSDEVSSDGAIATASGAAGVLDESKTGSGKKVNRPPKNTRVYIFKNDSSLSKEVERYLDNIGLKKFDLYNLTLLRHLPNFECLIFIQQEDSKYVNQIPGLLRLKRDLRVVFVTYNILDDVMNKQYTMIFPRAGMVLMDESALIACKSEVLDGLCQFMRKQTFEKGTAWKLLITSNTFKILDQLTYQLEDDIEEHVRITEVSQILQTYKTSGIVEVLSDEFHMSDPKSTADYQACFLALQRARHGSCRHFLFVTDMPRNHPDAKMFLTNGIDIMNVVEFMRCFVSKAVTHSPKVFESFVTRYTPEKYLDAPISDCSQTITF